VGQEPQAQQAWEADIVEPERGKERNNSSQRFSVQYLKELDNTNSRNSKWTSRRT
jgi:hypothetical protein